MSRHLHSIVLALLVTGLHVGIPDFLAGQPVSVTATYLKEGFEAGAIPVGWSVQRLVGSTATWTVAGTGSNPPIAPFAGSGQARFNSYDASAGEQARLVTPRLDLSAAVDPFVEVYMYHDDEFLDQKDSVYVEVSTVDSITGPWTTIYGLERPRSSPAWLKAAISLLMVKGNPRVFLGMRGVSKFGNNVFMDEFRVADSSFHDIGAVAVLDNRGSNNFSLVESGQNSSRRSRAQDEKDPVASSGPSVAILGPEWTKTFAVVVQNFGTFAEPLYQIKWSVDGQSQTPTNNTRTLARNGLDTLNLNWPAPSPGWHLVTAWTSLAADSNARNDTARIGALVLDSAVVFYESFNGEQFPPAGWSVINRDAGPLSAWFRGSVSSVLVPYEGSGFAADNFQRANGTYLDDYLITPTIPNVGRSGLADSLIFWVRSVFYQPPAVNFPDSLMVLVSTTGADTSSFSTVLAYSEAPKTGWTRWGYRLNGTVPENSTIRVAFRYLHYSAGSSGNSSDFIGIDAVQLVRRLPTSVPEDRAPDAFVLRQNFPNPFNPTTAIVFELPRREAVRVAVYDVLGREIGVLVNQMEDAGTHTTRWDATGLASGVYFCRMSSPSFTQMRRMLLLR